LFPLMPIEHAKAGDPYVADPTETEERQHHAKLEPCQRGDGDEEGDHQHHGKIDDHRCHECAYPLGCALVDEPCAKRDGNEHEAGQGSRGGASQHVEITPVVERLGKRIGHGWTRDTDRRVDKCVEYSTYWQGTWITQLASPFPYAYNSDIQIPKTCSTNIVRSAYVVAALRTTH